MQLGRGGSRSWFTRSDSPQAWVGPCVYDLSAYNDIANEQREFMLLQIALGVPQNVYM